MRRWSGRGTGRRFALPVTVIPPCPEKVPDGPPTAPPSPPLRLVEGGVRVNLTQATLDAATTGMVAKVRNFPGLDMADEEILREIIGTTIADVCLFGPEEIATWGDREG